MSNKLKTGIAVCVGLAVVALFFAFQNPFTMNDNSLSASAGTTNQQLVAQDETVGTGAQAVAGKTVTVNYTGRLQDGTVFDSSVGRDPYTFVLGAGSVIPGWDQGLQGMKVGGKRLLVVPPQLAYGAEDYGPIPSNSTLIFEVELLDVK